MGSLCDPHICPRLVPWKVGQREDRQQLVRFPFQILCRHSSSQPRVRSLEGTMRTLTSWPPSSPSRQTAVSPKMATATILTSLPADASLLPYTQFLPSDHVTTHSKLFISSFSASMTSVIALLISLRWISNFIRRPAPQMVSLPSCARKNSGPSSTSDGIW